MSWMQMRRMPKTPTTRQVSDDGWKMNARNHARRSRPGSLSFKTRVKKLTFRHAKGCCIWTLSVMSEAKVTCVLGRGPFSPALLVVASLCSQLVRTTCVAYESRLHCNQMTTQFQRTTRTAHATRTPMQMFAMRTSSCPRVSTKDMSIPLQNSTVRMAGTGRVTLPI